MLSKRTHPMIGKLSELLVSVNRATFPDSSTSPRGPLDFKICQSPKNNSKKYHDLGGIGLGIVAALEKSSNCSIRRQEIVRKYAVSGSGPTQSRSDPIPVKRNNDEESGFQDTEMESLEEYTYITCHRGPNESYTLVFKDGDELHRSGNIENERFGSSKRCNDVSFEVAKESPGRSMEYPCLDFLSSCHLCKKNLHGKDIYMYRGEKAFCSVDCRSSYIMMEERKENCRSEVSTSPYTAGQIFSTGVLVT